MPTRTVPIPNLWNGYIARFCVAAFVAHDQCAADSGGKPATQSDVEKGEGERAVLGIEPRTSRTLSENHATRPSSRCREVPDCI